MVSAFATACRGGAKSWTIALLLALRARVRPIRILCVREYQNSIRDSSKRLIEQSIERLGLGARGDQFFSSNEREIRGRNRSIISFLGLNGKEASIKSLEGIDIVWIEEAATITQASIEALIPTIRREGAQRGGAIIPGIRPIRSMSCSAEQLRRPVQSSYGSAGATILGSPTC